MTSAYVLMFLTFFAILGDKLVHKYLYHQINEGFSKPSYEVYVHRPRPHRLSGLNMRSVLQEGSISRDAFCKLINYVYKKSIYYDEELAENLLTIFKEKIAFEQTQLKEGMILYRTPIDLDELQPPKKLEESYLFLMRGSEIVEGDKEGFPSLKTFFYPGDDHTISPILNLYNTPLKLIGALFGKRAEEDIKKIREATISHNLSREEENILLNDFITSNRAKENPFSEFVHFKVENEKRPQ